VPTTSRARHDVVIVGARAAGAGTALSLARLGHDVLVVERAELPSDTISTHQIVRTGVVALHRWGLLNEVLASGAPALRQYTFHEQGKTTIRAVKDKSGVDHLIAPRRYVLDTIVAEAAVKAGATLWTGATVAGVRLDDTGRATGVYGYDRAGEPFEVEARFVIGADGLSSRVARSVGAEVIEDRGAGGAARYAYFAELAVQGLEFYTEARGFAGVFPTNGDEACVWICTPEADARGARRSAGSTAAAFAAQVLRAAPGLSRRLAVARRTSAVRGMLRMPNQRRQAYGPGWALVGDAGYHRDAVSAQGISDAFRDAEFLAVALDGALRGRIDEGSALAGYQRRRDAALRTAFELTCALVAYPSVPDFTDAMRRLGAAIDIGAATLAAQPVPGGSLPSRRERSAVLAEALTS
jgi:flavin-dependent dehydrogenase